MDLESCEIESSRRGRRRSGSSRMVPSSMVYPKMERHRVEKIHFSVLKQRFLHLAVSRNCFQLAS